MKLAFINLGCPKNVVDLEIILGMIKPHVEFSDSPENADVTLVNTCAFIDSAKEQAIDHILNIARLKQEHPSHQLWVSGCLPQRYQNNLCKEIPEIDVCLTSTDPRITAQQLLTLIKKPLGPQQPRKQLTLKHYAYLEISKGCSNRCAYCAIPLIKGNHISRPPEEILDEAEQLVQSGARELILVAQDTTFYGHELGSGTNLAGLLTRLNRIGQLRWIRLLYTHPAHWNDDLIECVAELDKVVNYVDLPIQHINNRILQQMGRKVTRKQVVTLLQKLRRQIPGLALRTSLIVGYPGETEKEFKELFDFINHFKFERLGVFTYSHEEDTRACQLPDSVRRETKIRREEKIMHRQAEINLHFNESLIGKTVAVLIDETENGISFGRTQWDAPEIDNSVILYQPLSPGSLVDVQVTSADYHDLIGRAAKA